jgi:hypothetical protein
MMNKLIWYLSVLEILIVKICFSTKKMKQDHHVAIKLGKEKERQTETEKDVRIPAKQNLCAGSMDGTCGEK